ALGRGGDPLRRARPRPSVRGAPALRPGRPLPPAGRLRVRSPLLAAEDPDAEARGQGAAELLLQLSRSHLLPPFRSGGQCRCFTVGQARTSLHPSFVVRGTTSTRPCA